MHKQRLDLLIGMLVLGMIVVGCAPPTKRSSPPLTVAEIWQLERDADLVVDWYSQHQITLSAPHTAGSEGPQTVDGDHLEQAVQNIIPPQQRGLVLVIFSDYFLKDVGSLGLNVATSRLSNFFQKQGFDRVVFRRPRGSQDPIILDQKFK